jgi:hypothetical protein
VSTNNDENGNIELAIASIEAFNHKQLCSQLKDIHDVNYNASVLLWCAVLSQNGEAVKILLAHGAIPNEPIMASAINIQSVDIITALADAEPGVIKASGCRVLQMMFTVVLCNWNDAALRECCEHLYELLENHTKANLALAEVNKIKSTQWLSDLLTKQSNEKVRRYNNQIVPTL